MKKKINVVVFGGGNGSAISLNALKRFVPEISLSAIIATSDNSGSSGRLRSELNWPPPADIMRAVLAMSVYDYGILKKIFYNVRFANAGKLTGHDLGNLFVMLSAEYGRNFIHAVNALCQAVASVGRVYPATLSGTDLKAKLSDGTMLATESLIDRPVHNRQLKIDKLFLNPSREAYQPGLKAIRSANIIIFGPGSLYTSIVAAILPRGIYSAIHQSKAKLVYIPGDAFETIGEAGPESLSGLVKALDSYLPRPVDVVIYNNSKLTARQQKTYRQRHWEQFKKDAENLPGRRLIGADLEIPEGGLSSQKLGRVLKNVIARPPAGVVAIPR